MTIRGRRKVLHKRSAEVTVEAPAWFMGPNTFAGRTRVGAFSYFLGGAIDHCTSVRIGEPEHPTTG